VRLANNRHEATISNLNDRKTSSDLNYAAMEGANAHAYVPPTYEGGTPATPAPAGRVANPSGGTNPAQFPKGPRPDDLHQWNGTAWVYTGPNPSNGKDRYHWNAARNAWVHN
jgi:hypothetical protein